MTTSATRTLTFEEWRELPETKQRYEIVDGVMIVPPGPNAEHQWVQLELAVILRMFLRSTGLGVVLTAPMDVMIQRDPLRVRQPDIMMLNSERTGIRGISDVKDMPFIEAAPDIVIEVLSPSNTRREMERRLADYQSIGVYESWLISPQAETAEIIDLRGAEPRTTAVYGSEDTLTSALLPGFELKLSEIFR